MRRTIVAVLLVSMGLGACYKQQARQASDYIFNKPDNVWVQQPYEVAFLLLPPKRPFSPEEEKGQTEGLPGELQRGRVRYGPLMSAKLDGVAFQIEELTPKVQRVNGTDLNRWAWKIVPKERGEHYLDLSVSIHKTPEADGVPTSIIPVLREKIKVNATFVEMAKNWANDLDPIWTFGSGVIAAAGAAFMWFWNFRRPKRKDANEAKS